MSTLAVNLRVPREQFEVDVDFSIDGVVGLVGASGSGKSTLLRAVAGLEPTATGSVSLDGAEVIDGVGYLGQVDGLFPHLSAQDNVAYVLRAAGARKVDARAAAILLLNELGLRDFARTMPGKLSGGQRRRVALARALAARREVFLLDEPFAGLDEDSADRAARFIAGRLLDHDAPALIAGHDIDRLDRICGRIARIERGRLAASVELSAEVVRPRDQAPAAEPRSTGDTPADFPEGSR